MYSQQRSTLVVPESEPVQRKLCRKILLLFAAIVVISVIVCGGLVGYNILFAKHAISVAIDNAMMPYDDQDSDESRAVIDNTAAYLSGLGSCPPSNSKEYSTWLEESSYYVEDVIVSDDHLSAIAIVTIVRDSPLELLAQNPPRYQGHVAARHVRISLSFEMAFPFWTTDDAEFNDSVQQAFLPSNEDVIGRDLYYFLGDLDTVNEELATGLEQAAGEDLGTLGISAEEFSDAYLDGFGYEIGDITVDGDTATAEVTVTVKSFNDIMTTFQTDFTEWVYSTDLSTMTSEDDFYKEAGRILLETVQNAEATESTLTVDYTKDGDDWTMDPVSQSEVNALFGV